jgi:hypothetical protein
MAHGGEVEHNGPQSHTAQFLKMALGGSVPMRGGGQIPGQALKEGDSPHNDFVPIMASPGEVMLPRSVTQSGDPGAKAKAFMDKIAASRRAR